MERTTFIDRLSAALKAEVPQGVLRKAWYGRAADDLEILEDRLQAYTIGENECPGSVLLRMFDHFGPEFETRVRGRQAESRLSAIRELVRRLQDAVDGKTTTVPMEGKVS